MLSYNHLALLRRECEVSTHKMWARTSWWCERTHSRFRWLLDQLRDITHLLCTKIFFLIKTETSFPSSLQLCPSWGLPLRSKWNYLGQKPLESSSLYFSHPAHPFHQQIPALLPSNVSTAQLLLTTPTAPPPAKPLSTCLDHYHSLLTSFSVLVLDLPQQFLSKQVECCPFSTPSCSLGVKSKVLLLVDKALCDLSPPALNHISSHSQTFTLQPPLNSLFLESHQERPYLRTAVLALPSVVNAMLWDFQVYAPRYQYMKQHKDI